MDAKKLMVEGKLTSEELVSFLSLYSKHLTSIFEAQKFLLEEEKKIHEKEEKIRDALPKEQKSLRKNEEKIREALLEEEKKLQEKIREFQIQSI